MSYRQKYEDNGKRRYGDDAYAVETRRENARKGMRSAYGVMSQRNKLHSILMNQGRTRLAAKVREIGDRYLDNMSRYNKFKEFSKNPNTYDEYSVGFTRDEYMGNGKGMKRVKSASKGRVSG